MPYRPKLFAGIELDEEVRQRCAAISAQLRDGGLDGRFDDASKFHITLAFLGRVEAERVDEISESLASIGNAAQPFTLTLDKIGAFPNERRPKVVWIGARDQGAPFRRLARAARTAYEQLGFRFNKDAVAHVTVARVKSGNAHVPMIDVPAIHVRVEEIALFESLPAGKTTRYEVRARAPLNPNA
jgi:2'-5' RNA ligase